MVFIISQWQLATGVAGEHYVCMGETSATDKNSQDLLLNKLNAYQSVSNLQMNVHEAIF